MEGGEEEGGNEREMRDVRRRLFEAREFLGTLEDGTEALPLEGEGGNEGIPRLLVSGGADGEEGAREEVRPHPSPRPGYVTLPARSEPMTLFGDLLPPSEGVSLPGTAGFPIPTQTSTPRRTVRRESGNGGSGARSPETDALLRSARNALRTAVGFAERLVHISSLVYGD